MTTFELDYILQRPYFLIMLNSHVPVVRIWSYVLGKHNSIHDKAIGRGPVGGSYGGKNPSHGIGIILTGKRGHLEKVLTFPLVWKIWAWVISSAGKTRPELRRLISNPTKVWKAKSPTSHRLFSQSSLPPPPQTTPHSLSLASSGSLALRLCLLLSCLL